MVEGCQFRFPVTLNDCKDGGIDESETWEVVSV